MKRRRFFGTWVGLTSVVWAFSGLRSLDMGTPTTVVAFVVLGGSWIAFYVWAEERRWWAP